ncbi:MAG: molybdopterin-binding protein, partial [Planctomycetota bacterium]
TRIQEWGAIPLPRPVLLDTPEAVRAGLRQTLSLRPDVVVTIGGISAGDLDYVREVARELGDDIQVRKVCMKPGKPLVDGHIGGIPFFGLPGNAAACLVSFEIFVRPALARLEGRPDGLPPRREALVLETRATPGGGRLQFLRGQVRYHAESSEYQLQPLAGQGSHMLSSFAKANCLVELPPQQHQLRQGERVSVLLLGPGVNP